MVEDEVGDFIEFDPVRIVRLDKRMVVFLDVHEGVVRRGEHPLPGVAPGIAVGMDLTHVQVAEARKFRDDAAGGVVQTLAFLHESAHQGPLSLRRLEVALEQQEAQFPLLEPEDDAVHGGVELGMDAVVGLRGH